MAYLDFANMTKQDLSKFRHKAIKAGERPSAQNNYFTTTFSAGVSNKQPDDYVSTALFKTWSEHHGPANHLTAECHSANGLKTKPASQLRAEADARRMVKFMKHIDKALVALKIKERREKQAAKRRQETTEGQG